MDNDFLRDEFMWIDHKLGAETDLIAEVKHLLDDSTSLDEIFKALHIPILLTYKSPCVSKHKEGNSTYCDEVAAEIQQHFAKICAYKFEKAITLHFILVPLEGKARLLQVFNEKLSALHSL